MLLDRQVIAGRVAGGGAFPVMVRKLGMLKMM